MRKAYLLIPVFIVAGLGVSALTMQDASPSSEQYISSGSVGLTSAQAYLLPLSNPSYAPIRDTSIPDPIIDANAGLVYDIDAGTYLYQKNIDTKLPIASLTKILSALVAQDHFDPGEVVSIASSSVKVDGQRQTLYEGERLTMRDLIHMMLIESSNDAAYAIAQYAHSRGIDFVAQMNRKAGDLGMANCIFTDPAGLDDQAYCTGRDLVKLVRATLRQAPDLWSIMATKEIAITSVDQKMLHTVKSTNELLGQIPGIVGGKTGNTDGALGCLILVVKLPQKGDTLMSIVLGSRSRFGDTKGLFDWLSIAYHLQ